MFVLLNRIKSHLENCFSNNKNAIMILNIKFKILKYQMFQQEL